ncbi:AbiH family protein [Streptococcus uberis]|uniref:AbiH family protein n=3 Tax=Streptococcus uberis TaxID=1349 RepID=UPI003D6AECD5
MENLFIIGNGFDLAHELPTAYSDFKWFLYNNYDLSDISFDDAEQIYDFEMPESTLDGSGEERFDFNRLAQFYFKMCNQLNQDSVTFKTDWTDFENNLANVTELDIDLENFQDTDGVFDGFYNAGLREDTSDMFNIAYQKMTQEYFFEWIEEITNSSKYKNLCEEKSHLKKLILDLKDDSYFLTFNYTTVLEEFYNIPSNQILHIHGSLENTELIVGHGKESKDEKIEYSPFELSFTKAKESSLKPVRDIIKLNHDFFNQLSSVKNVYIIGSRLLEKDSVDFPYFEEIIKSTSSLSLFIDSFRMTAKKKKHLEDYLLEKFNQTYNIEVIDSYHNCVLPTIHQ